MFVQLQLAFQSLINLMFLNSEMEAKLGNNNDERRILLER